MLHHTFFKLPVLSKETELFFFSRFPGCTHGSCPGIHMESPSLWYQIRASSSPSATWNHLYFQEGCANGAKRSVRIRYEMLHLFLPSQPSLVSRVYCMPRLSRRRLPHTGMDILCGRFETAFALYSRVSRTRTAIYFPFLKMEAAQHHLHTTPAGLLCSGQPPPVRHLHIVCTWNLLKW